MHIFKRIQKGLGTCHFSPRSWNWMCNAWESIEGVGCRIVKTASGNGCMIIVDGNTTDVPFPDDYERTDFSSCWPKGGDETECYGTAIGYTDGDDVNVKQIDLANKRLMKAWSLGSVVEGVGDGVLTINGKADGTATALSVTGKAFFTDATRSITVNPALITDADNVMTVRQVTVYIPDGSGGLQGRKIWLMASAGVNEGSAIEIGGGLPDGAWTWGRVEYDDSGHKFVQYKDVWDATEQEFVESEEATDIIELESHSSQHV